MNQTEILQILNHLHLNQDLQITLVMMARRNTCTIKTLKEFLAIINCEITLNLIWSTNCVVCE